MVLQKIKKVEKRIIKKQNKANKEETTKRDINEKYTMLR